MKILTQIITLVLSLTSTQTFAGGGSGGGGVRPQVDRQYNDLIQKNEINFRDLRNNSNLINLKNKFVFPKKIGQQSAEIYVGEIQDQSWQVRELTLEQNPDDVQNYEALIQKLQNAQDWNFVAEELQFEINK